MPGGECGVQGQWRSLFQYMVGRGGYKLLESEWKAAVRVSGLGTRRTA